MCENCVSFCSSPHQASGRPHPQVLLERKTRSTLQDAEDEFRAGNMDFC